MKFLILSQYFHPEIGATQVRLSSMCAELIRVGHEVEVVTAMPHHPEGKISKQYRNRLFAKEFQGGVRVRRVWLYAANGSGFRRVLNYLSFMLTCSIGLLQARKPDFVFVDSPPLFLGIPGWLASRLWKCPFIFNVADLWPDSVCDLGVMKKGILVDGAYRLERWIYEQADYVTAVTDGVRDSLVQRKNVPPHKILFLPNGVDTRLIAPCAPDEHLKISLGLDGKRIAIYAGNHGYAAGAEQILYAAQHLSSNQQLHFLFVGDGPEKPALRKLAADLNLTNVTFLDSVELKTLPSLLSIAELALITLRKARVTMGARPAKAFVMMAAAKPIVLAAVGEAENLVRASGAGIVVPPDDPRAMANAIQTLLDDPALAKQIGTAGRTYVERYFEWSVLVRDWLQQLQQASTVHNTSETNYELPVTRSPAKP